MTSQPTNLVAMFAAKRKLLVALIWLWSLWLCMAQSQNSTASSEGRVEPLKLSSASGYTTSKRQINGHDLAGSATAKSYEPPPEFYRGPGSGSGSSASDSTTADFISKPISSLATGGGGGGGGGLGAKLGSLGDSLSHTYNNWRGDSNYNGGDFQDRISVGHYGGGAHAQSPHGGGSAGYAYEGHPYEYAAHGSYGGGGGGGVGSHYAGGSAGGAYYGSSSAETGLPYDVYGSRPGSAHSHYAGGGGGGGEYSYTYPYEGHDVATHKGPPELSQKALLAKSFLIPLASAAVLGIAAALVSNPLLLQLGTVSGLGGLGPTVVGKRRRRRSLQRPFAGWK